MPSIFNHDNACWGVKRSFCNVFQYDLSEDLQTRKLNELSNVPNYNSQSPEPNSVHYSVSSNGYYGFQPHNVIHNQTNDSAMEIEENDIVSSSMSASKLTTLDCSVLTTNPNPQINMRKRHINDSFAENNKRSKHEEVVDTMATNVLVEGSRLDSHQWGGGYVGLARCWIGSGQTCDSTTEQLLRQTHGCEVYLYDRNCDY